MNISVRTLALANKLAEKGFSRDALVEATGGAIGKAEALSIIETVKRRAVEARRRAEIEVREAILQKRRDRLDEILRQAPDASRCPSLAELVECVAAKHGMTVVEMLAFGRQSRLVQARHEAMYLAACLTRASTPQIGRALGGMDHTTVLAGIKKHAARNNLPLPRGMKA